MEFLFRGNREYLSWNSYFAELPRAGGIEVAPEHRIFPPREPKARRSHAGPGLARRILADARGGAPFHAVESLRLAVESLRLWRKRRAAVRELSALSDHTLKDIGLHRGEIRSVVQDMIGSEVAKRAGGPVSKTPVRRPRPAEAFLGAQPCEQPC